MLHQWQMMLNIIPKTIQQSRTSLNKHFQFLSTVPYYQLGSDTKVVQEILQDVEQILQDFDSLAEPVYTSKINIQTSRWYYRAKASLRRLATTLKAVANEHYGSVTNTERVVTLLSKCIDHLNQLEDQVITKESPNQKLEEELSANNQPAPPEIINTIPALKATTDEKNLLLNYLKEYFNLVDLREVCFKLGADFEDLSGKNKTDMALSLIEEASHQGRLEKLRSIIKEKRPHLEI